LTNTNVFFSKVVPPAPISTPREKRGEKERRERRERRGEIFELLHTDQII
jgi:hypothetical protein